MAKKNCGRPPVNKNDCSFQIQDPGFLALTEFGKEIHFLISNMASYRIIKITGRSSEKQTPELVASRNAIQKQQEEIFQKKKKIKLEKDHIFFLTKSSGKEYEIRNGIIQQCKKEIKFYPFITTQLSAQLIGELQLLFQELNPDTQRMIQDLICHFKECKKDNYVNEMIDYIHQNTKQYEELLLWDELYECSYNTKISMLQTEIQAFDDKIKQNNNENEKNKVKDRKMNQKQCEQTQIFQLEEFQPPNRPLKYFLNEFFSLFMKIVDEIPEI